MERIMERHKNHPRCCYMGSWGWSGYSIVESQLDTTKWSNTINRSDIRPTVVNTLTRVSEVLDAATKEWNLDFLNQVLPPNIVQNIASIDLNKNSSQTDNLIWPLREDGVLTVKSVYEYLVGGQVNPVTGTHLSPVWRHIWSLEVLPRIQVFVWKC